MSETIFNHDLLMIADKCDRIKVELQRSQSNPVSGMTDHDIARFKTYIDDLKALKAWVIDQPVLDLPETHPREFVVPEAPETIAVESEVINHLVRMIDALRVEMVNCQSARYASSMIGHDGTRFDAVTDKMLKFVDDYVVGNTPLDLPESSPSEPVAPAGSKGV